MKKSMKRLAALMMALAVVLVSALAPVVTAEAATALSGKKYIYFQDKHSWGSKLNVHSWVPNGAGTSWPGEKAVYVGKNDNMDFYRVIIDSTKTMIIFNNGSKQTVDLSLPTSGTHIAFWISNSETDSKYTGGNWILK